MTALDILVQWLALARVLHLCIEEDGPFRVLVKFRKLIGINEMGVYSNELGGLFSCHLCLGIWLAPVIVLLYHYVPWLVWCLAVAQGAALIYVLMERIMYETSN